MLTPDILLACIAAMARIGVACLFAVAAIAKLRRQDDWVAAVSGYRLLPNILVSPVARALPPLEIAVAAGLLAGLPIAFAGAAGLLALFASAMAINLLRGRRDVDCGCDPSARPRPIGWALVARNLVFGSLMLLGLAPLPALDMPFLIVAGGAGLLAFLLGHILTLLGSFAPRRPAVPASGVR